MPAGNKTSLAGTDGSIAVLSADEGYFSTISYFAGLWISWQSFSVWLRSWEAKRQQTYDAVNR
jgi:hypothetical protein